MLPDAVKNPLIYLNFAVYCVQLKRYDLAVTNLTNFFSVAEHVNVRHEVSQLFTLNIGFDAKIKWMTLSSPLYTVQNDSWENARISTAAKHFE